MRETYFLVSGNALFGGLDPSLYLDPDRIEEKEEVRAYTAAETKLDKAPASNFS